MPVTPCLALPCPAGSNDLAIGIDWASKGLNFKGNLGTISLYNQALTGECCVCVCVAGWW